MNTNVKKVLNSFDADKITSTFWRNFQKFILLQKKVELENDDFRILSDIIKNIHCYPEKLDYIANFLKSVTSPIPADLGYIIGNSINQILNNHEKQAYSEAKICDYFKSITYLSTNFPNIKNIIMESTISTFSEVLLNLTNFGNSFIQELFQLEVTLLLKCQESKKIIHHYITSFHFTSLFKEIINSHNSLTQMIVIEWMWRAKNCFSTNEIDFTKIFGEEFIQLDSMNFRQNLHQFVRELNKNNEFIKHIEFSNLKYCHKNVSVGGWIDLQQDNITIWFFHKNQRIPDVLVLNNNQISNLHIHPNKNIIEFFYSSRIVFFEELFALPNNSPRISFEFTCIFHISDIQSFLKLIQRKKNPIMKDSQMEEGDLICSEFYSHLPNRIYAGMNSVFDLENSLKEIENDLTKMIDDAESKIIDELNTTIKTLNQNMQILESIQERNKIVIFETLNTGNESISEVKIIKQETKYYFSKKEKTIEKQHSIFRNIIIHKKKQFLKETHRIFSNNVLVTLSKDAINLRNHTKALRTESET
ncbi:hypothetical protein TRFO_05261 [Tritrichomonas foetus]|uniref:Uncharacterized protein n=1 Tax=Tritrichomonas foetus TaxID=1144522 RepID=A0A1J4K789_9EUKA|nr:hypothetical protein TRFO_05261 [Tritrichomonas foetus]|eukprot:OHT07067.1 hypothetical protein TRFO_05261 [Tritrichomonas foetus]